MMVSEMYTTFIINISTFFYVYIDVFLYKNIYKNQVSIQCGTLPEREEHVDQYRGTTHAVWMKLIM